MTKFRYIESGSSGYVAKKPKIRHMEEAVLQRPIVKALERIERKWMNLTFFHVPNQLLRTSALRKIYAGLGVRSGVTDLVIPIDGGRTLWVELKYKRDDSTDDQIEFHAKLRGLGHRVEIIVAETKAEALEKLFEILQDCGVQI